MDKHSSKHPVAKTHPALAISDKHPKNKTTKHHHRKPYRKRHYSMLILSVVLSFALMAFILLLRQKTDIGIKDSKIFMAGVFNQNKQGLQTIHSTLGFGLEYDSVKYFASAIDSATGELFVADELMVRRPYEIIKITPIWANNNIGNTLTAKYFNDIAVTNINNGNVASYEIDQALGGLDVKQSTLIKTSSSSVTINGQVFVKSTWTLTPKSTLASKLVSYYTTYTGSANGKLLTVTVNKGFTNNIDSFEEVVKTIYINKALPLSFFENNQYKKNLNASNKLINSLTLTKLASALSNSNNVSASEMISAKYSPSVVRVFNAYCMDIMVKGKLYYKDYCDGIGGSAFILTADGYIATNGHVVNENAKDSLIYAALLDANEGNTKMLEDLAILSGLTLNDINSSTNENEVAELIIDKFYTIQDDFITSTNNVTNLLVGLNSGIPDVKELVTLTEQRKKYPEQDNIKPAKIEALDYFKLDGIIKFKKSDVAIIKIEKNNLPTVTLGNFDGMAQGSNITILGYPVTASDNMLVDFNKSKVTLTGGKVSSIKNAKGSDKMLIETDATIGHGNSGGPVFNDNGEVIGIATYTIDESGDGGGVFNYVRDIKDLIDLASENKIEIDNNSVTQNEWQKGINYFYNARYSKAIKNFNKVKELYPEHPTVNSFIYNSEAKIKAGQDIKDLPILWFAVGGVVALAGIGVSVFLILRHKKMHKLYNEQLIGAGPVGGKPVSASTNTPPQYTSFGSGPIIAAPAATPSNLSTASSLPLANPVPAASVQVDPTVSNVTTASETVTKQTNLTAPTSVPVPVVSPAINPINPTSPITPTQSQITMPTVPNSQTAVVEPAIIPEASQRTVQKDITDSA